MTPRERAERLIHDCEIGPKCAICQTVRILLDHLQSLTADLTRMKQDRDAAIQRAEEWHEQFNRARKLTDTAIDNQIRIRQEQEAAEAAQTRLREALELAAGRIGHTPRCGHVRYGECDCDREAINERILAALTPKEPS